MKPLRITIKNFGAIPAADIDLTGVTCAAIAGPNGAGKSTAFTIAPMFALFGTTKAGTSADDMVKTGTSEAAVVFDFEHQGDVWRVIRTRSTKGKGKTTLELQRQSGELWASESGASISETQKKIVDLLGLDEETFSSSSMILQGRANEFTSRPAGQRKAILAQILQLDQYEGLQEKARTKANSVMIQLERDKAMASAISGRLAERADVEAELTEAKSLLAATVEMEKKADAAIVFGRDELAKLTLRQEQANGYLKQIEELQRESSRKETDRAVHQDRLDKASAFLRDEQSILTAAADYDRIRDQVTALQAKDDQRVSLAKDGRDVAVELEQVSASLAKVMADIVDAEKLLAARPELETAAAQQDDATKDLARWEVSERSHNDYSSRLANVDSELLREQRRINVETAAKAREIGLYVDRTAMLKDAKCIDIDRAECRFLSDAKLAAEKAKELQSQFDEWQLGQQQIIANLSGQQKGLAESITVVGYDAAAHADAKARLAGILAKVMQLKSLEGSAKLLETLQAQRVDLGVRQAALTLKRSQLREDYRKLQEELASLPALSEQMAKLEKYVKQREMLPAIREQQKSAQEQIAALDAEIDNLAQRQQQAENDYYAIVPDKETVLMERINLSEQQEKLEWIRSDKSSAILRIGSLQAKWFSLANDAVEHAAILERMAPLAQELTRWQTLVKAFGRDGIPALIIENAVPDLERIANEILGQMSGGRHNLRFETQRELKSKSGMAETLDIIVGDWAGERIYETFSGGEQLRIDFAIRFALAELLARRAGSRIDWLTVDEGWGSQSDEFLPLVIDAVKNIAGRFGMVLVISHIKQVQEAFEQQITFRPNGEAVEVRVA